VTLREELAVTEEYLSIEQVRFGPRLAVSLNVSPRAYEAQVPRFLLQPIVENAIRHGIARRPKGGEVAIRASAIEDQLRIEIENDRPSQGSPQPHERGEGVGLANTRTRLETLYGQQGMDAPLGRTPAWELTLTTHPVRPKPDAVRRALSASATRRNGATTLTS
jgi:LytS/YehU family sensor histidine kinase